MNAFLILLGVVAFISTLLGGLLTIKFKKYLPYFFAFGAGTLIAVSFLDILPESINLAQEIGFPIRYIMIIVVLSFFFYTFIERLFLTHPLEGHEGHGHIMGPIGASSLIIHSFLDGAAVGAAFQVNAAVGLIVAIAVISHDFTDGINTVTLMLKNKHNAKKAMIFLVFDALAPILGVLATALITIPPTALAIILAIFVGEFLYIGAANLLPETKQHMSKKIILAMGLGIALIIFLTSLI